MLRIVILFGFLYGFAFSGSSQEHNHTFEDFRSEKDLGQKSYIASVLWNEYLRNDLDSLKIISRLLMLEAVASGDKYAKAIANRNFGSYNIRTGKIDEGIRELQLAADLLDQLEEYEILTETYNELGNAFILKGEPIKSIPYFEKSLKTGKLSPEASSKYLAEGNYAQALLRMGKIEEAEKRANRSYKMAENANKKEAMATAQTILGNIALAKNDSVAASQHYKNSVELYLSLDSKAQASNAYNNLAILFFNQGLIKESELNFRKALDLRMEVKNASMVSESFYNLGELFLLQKNYTKSAENYIDAYDVAYESNVFNLAADAALAIIELAKLSGDNNLRKEYQSKHEILNGMIDNDYQLSEANKSHYEQDLRMARKENLQLEKEKKLQEALEKERSYQKWLLLCFASIISAIFIAIIVRRRKNLS